MNIGNQTYVRLDDDVSFQILRTNPKLTTNTKLMYDGKNLFMEAYPAEPILNTRKYKGVRLLRNGLYNNDIKNFLVNTNTSAYSIGQKMGDTILGDNFDYQFENMYWCGVESIQSYTYPEKMGFISPLYIRKKLPNYFVIFKLDTPANTNLVNGDNSYDFKNDILKSAKIIKTFDLREGTPIGDYISNYINQSGFKYDKSIYVNFAANEIYYYGIDRYQGVLTQKVENIKDQMLDNDYTILKSDEYITGGFERNNLIFPYIINLEFLFDDMELSKSNDFKFARYFGLYCNNIDIQEIDVTGMGSNNKVFVNWDDTEIQNIKFDKTSFYYIKDKYNNLYSINDNLNVKCDIDIKNCMGYENNTISVPVERLEGIGCSTMILQIESIPDDSLGENIIVDINDENNYLIKRYISDSRLEKRSFNDNRFSSNGSIENIAEALAGAIKLYPPKSIDWITAYSLDDKIFISSTYGGSGTNDILKFDVHGNIKKLVDDFRGGTDVEGCLFKIDNVNKNLFINDEKKDRYVKCDKNMKNAVISTILPYVNDRMEFDDEHSVVVTDWFGPYAKMSKNNYIELIDKFYAKIGVLSFFPVKDFDFDTINSQYGNCSKMKDELKKIENVLGAGDSNENVSIPYGRFFTDNNEELNSEYEYFCENILPELCVSNKTVPYISKWGYTDESKDSCENPYRLNTSKIFETCNFSANTFVINGDIMEYTHSMPYYIVYNRNEDVDEYQYIQNEIIPKMNDTYEFDVYVSKCINLFRDTDVDNFDKIFGDCSTSVFNNKRFNKKYSRFLNGDDIVRTSTLFRGVKFEIQEYEGDKEKKTGKYNGYKFSFIYIPVEYIDDKNFSSMVYFVKNDKFKFIVGMMFFKPSEIEKIPFSKSNVYAGAMGYLKAYEKKNI